MHDDFWAGSAESYNDFLACKAKADAALEAKSGDDSEWEIPPMYTLNGNVGVVEIAGHLIPGEAGFYRLFGITGYMDIENALIEAVQDKNAKHILLAVRSPGGSVEGVSDAARMVKLVSEVKPMSAFSNMACSAAYWITSGAGHIMTTDTGMNGSIGVVKIHAERSKQLADAGVTVTVMRAGKYKMLENSVEPLTEDAKAEIQTMLDDLYESFAGTVAENRGVSYMVADQVMGQGRVFMGKRGVEAELVDSIGTFAEALVLAGGKMFSKPATTNISGSVTASVSTTLVLPDNGANPHTDTNTMKTKEELLALAAGIDTTVAATDTKPAATDTTTVDPAQAEDQAAATQAATQADAGVVALLTGQLAAAQEAGVQAAAEVLVLKGQLAAAKADAEASLAAVQADVAGLSAIVATAVKSMGVALNTQVVVEGASAKDLLAAHATVSATFKDKFKVGAVAASTVEVTESTTPAKKVLDNRFIHSVQSLK